MSAPRWPDFLAVYGRKDDKPDGAEGYHIRFDDGQEEDVQMFLAVPRVSRASLRRLVRKGYGILLMDERGRA